MIINEIINEVNSKKIVNEDPTETANLVYKPDKAAQLIYEIALAAKKQSNDENAN